MENLTAGKWNVLHYSVKIPFHLSRATAVDGVPMTRAASEIPPQQMQSESRASSTNIFIPTIKRCNCNRRIAQHAQLTHAR
jgi:hypothetical protein